MEDDKNSSRGREPVPAKLLAAIADERRGRLVTIARAGSEDLRFLDAFRANANAGGPGRTHIILREDPRTIEVWEEFLHGTRGRIQLIDRIGEVGAEVHVKRFMIRHRRLLKITDEDASVLARLLGDA